MTIHEAIELFKKHQRSTVKRSTLKSYGKFLKKVQERFSEQEVVSVTAEDISQFLEEYTENLNRSTRHLRYAQMKALTQSRGGSIYHRWMGPFLIGGDSPPK